jgi:hypothetical protein
LDNELRLKNDTPHSYEETLDNTQRKEGESDKEYSDRIRRVIAQGLAHIHWKKYQNTKFNQLIPIWENYFLYFMGKFSGIPEFERYHFSDYKKSLKRGIGICGDASMVMSQLLEQNGISNQIIAFPGHVVISARFSDGQELVFDPDFGVALPYSLEDINKTPSLINEHYTLEGYTAKDVSTLNAIYNLDFTRWNGVKHFITKKFYFEKIFYAMKWPLPIIFIVLSIISYIRFKGKE